MKKEPKNHHYVPKFYLEHFTMNGTDDDRLFVVDKRQRRSWISTPKKTARANDFYRVELDGLDSMGIEKALAQVEGACATVIREIVRTKTLPSGSDLNVLMNFVALSTVRVPSTRATHSHFINQVAKNVSRLAQQSTDGARLFRELTESEQGPLSDKEMKELQEFIQSDEYTIEVEQNWHIQTMIESVNVLLPALVQRYWAIWIADDGVPDLVCSDRPVALWASPPLPGILTPNFATPNTLLTIPLSRRVLLASRLEPLPSEKYVMDEVDVALMNTLRATYSNQIYSSEENWTWTIDGEILESQAFLDGLPPASKEPNTEVDILPTEQKRGV